MSRDENNTSLEWVKCIDVGVGMASIFDNNVHVHEEKDFLLGLVLRNRFHSGQEALQYFKVGRVEEGVFSLFEHGFELELGTVCGRLVFCGFDGINEGLESIDELFELCGV